MEQLLWELVHQRLIFQYYVFCEVPSLVNQLPQERNKNHAISSIGGSGQCKDAQTVRSNSASAMLI